MVWISFWFKELAMNRSWMIFLVVLFTGCCNTKVVGTIECRYEDPETHTETVAKVSFEKVLP